MKKSDIRQAMKFAIVFRFTDNLTTLNDVGEFERRFKIIYLPELVFIKEYLSNNEKSF